MADLLLIAHAPLASALAAVAAHAFPDCAVRLKALDIPSGMDLDAAEHAVREALSASGEVLMLCDAFGATPCNAAMRVADGVARRVVAGVSVPMLWRSLCYADEPLDKLVMRAVDGGVQGTLQVAAPRRMNQGGLHQSHDPNQHHDQQ
jgi:PTS system ascorbate-specific IIA component